MKLLSQLLLPLGFALPGALLAGEPPAGFREGLAGIAALGMPPMKGAQWVKLPDRADGSFSQSYEARELSVSLSGNSWKLPTEPETYLGFGSAVRIESPEKQEAENNGEDDDAEPGLLRKMLLKHREENPKPEKKPAPPAETVSLAAKDAAKLIEALAKPSAMERLDSSIRWGNSSFHGQLLLFAAQLNAAGETESADALAAALFNAVNDDSALIDSAIGHLADEQYNDLASRFFADTDWEAYRAGTDALLRKFPRGWANAPAVAMLRSQLQKRSSAPPALSLPGIEIKPEAAALLAKLLEKQETTAASDEDILAAQGIDISDYPASQRAQILAMLRARGMQVDDGNALWLLDPGGSETKTPVAALKSMGMDGLIALASVAMDETLIPMAQSGPSRSSYSSDESAEESLRRRYAALRRPTSRGEIAVSLLSTVIPAPDRDEYGSEEADAGTIAAAAIEFWKKNRQKDTIALATTYMQEGSAEQRSEAASFLAGLDDAPAREAFEKAVLGADSPIDFLPTVDAYLGGRKAAGKAFANAYISLLRKSPPDQDTLNSSYAGYAVREAGGLENYLKKLSLKVGDASLKKLISTALRAKPAPKPEPGPGNDPFEEDDEEQSPIAALGPALESVTLPEALEAFGNAATLASPDQWMEIHQLLLSRIYAESDQGEEDEKAAEIPAATLAIWKPLAARTDQLPEKGRFPEYARSLGAATTGDGSTLLLELAGNPKLYYSFQQFAMIEGSSESIMQFIRARNDARDAGREPEPWPDAERVDEARRNGISEKLASLAAAEIIPFVKSLPRDERLAFTEILPSYNDGNPAPPGLLELRQTLVPLNPAFAKMHDAEAATKLGLDAGGLVTAELITRISDTMLADPAAHSTTMVTFFPAAMNLGSSVLVSTSKDLDPEKMSNSGLGYIIRNFGDFGEREAMSAILIGNVSNMRAMENGKPVTLESEASAMEAFGKALESKSPVLPHVRITVLNREDAEKITNQ